MITCLCMLIQPCANVIGKSIPGILNEMDRQDQPINANLMNFIDLQIHGLFRTCHIEKLSYGCHAIISIIMTMLQRLRETVLLTTSMDGTCNWDLYGGEHVVPSYLLIRHLGMVRGRGHCSQTWALHVSPVFSINVSVNRVQFDFMSEYCGKPIRFR